MSSPDRTAMLDRAHAVLSIRRQCRLLGLARSKVYRPAPGADLEDLAIMRRLDELYLAWPFFGSRRMTAMPRAEGYRINRKQVRRLMRLMGLSALGPRPQTSESAPGHKIYPYLLRELVIERPNQVVGGRHHVHPDRARLLVSGRDHGLGEPGGSGVAAVEHAGCRLLRPSPGGGARPVRPARNLPARRSGRLDPCDHRAHGGELQAAIHRYLAEHNDAPKPFTWTKTANQIPAKLTPMNAPVHWDQLAAIAVHALAVAVLAPAGSCPDQSGRNDCAARRDPLIPKGEHPLATQVRAQLGVLDNQTAAPLDALDRLGAPLRRRLEALGGDLVRHHNPFVRHVIKRRRRDLKNPDGTPVFREVPVNLHGEGGDDALVMSDDMAAAYEEARAYCQLIAKIRPGAGILRTLLLRPIGSSLRAGLLTARKLRSGEEAVLVGEEDEGLTREGVADVGSEALAKLDNAIAKMEAAGDDDPKSRVVLN